MFAAGLLLAPACSLSGPEESPRSPPYEQPATCLPPADAEEECKTEMDCAAFRTPGGQPQDSGEGGPADADKPLIHAASRVFLGDTGWDGKMAASPPSHGAAFWKDFGADVDGWNSTPQQGFHCKPRGCGKASTIRQDGPDGLDNAFGKQIVAEIFMGLVHRPSEEVSGSLTRGIGTFALDLGKLGDAADYSATPAYFHSVLGLPDEASNPLAPGDDWSSYAWRPRSDGFGPDGVARSQFPSAYLANNIWYSGGEGVIDIDLVLVGFPLWLKIQKARVSLDLTDRKRGKRGMISGIIAAEDLVQSFHQAIGSFRQYCPSFEPLREIALEASDVLLDGTQDPQRECDGISIGLGFETMLSALGDPTSPPSLATCPP